MRVVTGNVAGRTGSESAWRTVTPSAWVSVMSRSATPGAPAAIGTISVCRPPAASWIVDGAPLPVTETGPLAAIDTA